MHFYSGFTCLPRGRGPLCRLSSDGLFFLLSPLPLDLWRNGLLNLFDSPPLTPDLQTPAYLPSRFTGYFVTLHGSLHLAKLGVYHS